MLKDSALRQKCIGPTHDTTLDAKTIVTPPAPAPASLRPSSRSTLLQIQMTKLHITEPPYL